MKRSDNAMAIYKALYMNPDEDTVEKVHSRVAKCVGSSEEDVKLFTQVLDEDIFRPNTPCMINARIPEEAEKMTDHDNNLVACFVLRLEDTMKSIMSMWSTCAHIYAGGGGAGFPISNLREKGSPISAGGVASGPIEYMKVIQTISDTVKSGGKARRAANLASFWYQHPDILEFIKSKTKYDFSAINISILVDDILMERVSNNEWETNIDLLSPNKNRKVGTIKVGTLWNAIINNAHLNGDPGLLFKTTANRYNPLPSHGEMECSNPCAEVVLAADSCCDLGSINLNKCLYNGEFLFNKLEKYSAIACRFLDNIIDKTSFPTEDFKKTMQNTRPVGIGLMGLADVFYKLRITYGSPESIQFFAKICQTITVSAFRESINLAKEKGAVPIPDVDRKHFIEYLKNYGLDDTDINNFNKYGIRNTNVTSIAPTGSISISAECSYAFEPMMALVWQKRLVDRDSTLTFVNEEFIKECGARGIELTDKLRRQIVENKGSIQNLDFPKDMKELFVVAHDVGWRKKIEMQAAGQRYITLAISSTCNLPNNATKEDVSEAYQLAWSLGLKGITVYRDGSYEDQPVSFGEVKHNVIEPMKIPSKRSGNTIKLQTGNGPVYITCNKVNDKLVEVFLAMGNIGELENLLLNTLSKIISKAIQYHIPPGIILEKMEEQGGQRFWFKLDEDKEITTTAESLVDGIAKIIRYHFLEEDVDGYNINKGKIKELDTGLSKCPSCGKKSLSRAVGCRGGMCSSCGYAACG